MKSLKYIFQLLISVISGTYQCGCHSEFESVDSVSGVCKAPGSWNILFSGDGNIISLNTTVRQEREVIFGETKVILLCAKP